jgi:DNA gyrase subunit A
VRGIRQTGRAAQGVTLMNVRDEDRVSAVALVVESEASDAVADVDPTVEGPAELSADSGEIEGPVGDAEPVPEEDRAEDGDDDDGLAPE